MNKPCGIRGDISPTEIFKDMDKTYIINGIEINIKESTITACYDNPSEETAARKLILNMVRHWSLRNNIKLEVNLNITWSPSPSGGRDIGLSLQDTIQLSDRVVTTTIIKRGMTYAIKTADSYSFDDDILVSQKALKYPILTEILDYFWKEVVDEKYPLYGIYKSIEEVMKQLGNGSDVKGRKILATLAGKTETYISELTETAQTQRHSSKWLSLKGAKKILNEMECRERAKILIDAYTQSLK